jgi:hypothetical protein
MPQNFRQSIPRAEAWGVQSVFWQFIRNHLITSVFMVVGAFISVGARINDAYSLINAGLPASAWEAIGAAIFFASVIVLLASWYKANEQREREQHELGPAAAIPTSIKLQFRSGTAGSGTVALQTANIWSWYLFRQRAQKAPPKKGQPPEQYIVATMLFLLFDRPVAWKQILVDGNALPQHEVKNSSRRHAIIHFVGAIPAGTVLEVKAQT